MKMRWGKTMNQEARRLSAVTAAVAEEAATAAPPRRWHRIVQEIGQTHDEALDAYGRDRIGPDDGIIVREIVRPQRVTRCVFVPTDE